MYKLLNRIAAVLFSCFVLAGCEITTEAPASPDLRPASHVVINEVFTLPSTNQAPYSWIEFLNPTTDTVDIQNYTITCSATKSRVVSVVVVDTLFNFRNFLGQTITNLGPGVYDIPFSKDIFSFALGGFPVLMLPNDLYTVVNNEQRLKDHTGWGPGPQETRFERPFFASLDSGVVLEYVRWDSIIVAGYQTTYSFQLKTTEELILKDENGVPIDRVRYGDYSIQGVDPSPNNHSLGMIPEFESMARFAGGYSTDNTANDFFVTTPTLRPIPNWYSQQYKLK